MREKNGGRTYSMNLLKETVKMKIAFAWLRIVAFAGFGGPSLGIVTSNLAFLRTIPKS
jgi:hypothetical protein